MTAEGETPDWAPVDSELYTEEYYLGCCSGAEAFEISGGLAVSPVVHDVMNRMGIGPGRRYLDVGSGRGEVVFNLAERGALAFGVDYADAALRLAATMLRRHPAFERRAVFVKGDAKALPFPPGSVDGAFMLDIVEHLRPWELAATLREVRRVLRPGAALFVHTMPNRRFYTWVYPALRLLALAQTRRPVPRDPRSRYERDMHVNEQTPAALRRALAEAGFVSDVWVVGYEKSPLRPASMLDRVARAAVVRSPLQRAVGFHILAFATVA